MVSEQKGRWGKALEVPGTAALNKEGDATVRSVSCPSTGSTSAANCVAGGSYRDGSFHFQAFIVSERNGRWHTAFEVPGTAALNVGGDGAVYAVSCPSEGNCDVGGTYDDRLLTGQAFVVTQKNGRWGKAIEVPGTAALNGGGQAAIFAMSCRSAGECSAGGSYRDASARLEVFVVTQT